MNLSELLSGGRGCHQSKNLSENHLQYTSGSDDRLAVKDELEPAHLPHYKDDDDDNDKIKAPEPLRHHNTFSSVITLEEFLDRDISESRASSRLKASKRNKKEKKEPIVEKTRGRQRKEKVEVLQGNLAREVPVKMVKVRVFHQFDYVNEVIGKEIA